MKKVERNGKSAMRWARMRREAFHKYKCSILVQAGSLWTGIPPSLYFLYFFYFLTHLPPSTNVVGQRMTRISGLVFGTNVQSLQKGMMELMQPYTSQMDVARCYTLQYGGKIGLEEVHSTHQHITTTPTNHTCHNNILHTTHDNTLHYTTQKHTTTLRTATHYTLHNSTLQEQQQHNNTTTITNILTHRQCINI